MIPEIQHRCPLLSVLDDAQLTEATADMRRMRLPPGSSLFRQGAEAQRFYVVESGGIKLTRLSGDGEEIVIEMIRAGESFAEAVMSMDARPYPVTTEAVDESVVLSLSNRRLLDLLSRDSSLALRMRVHGPVQEIEALSLHNATHRRISYFVSEVERGGTTALTLATKQVIALRKGITRKPSPGWCSGCDTKVCST